MNQFFKIVSYAEGLSFIALVFIAMPMKWFMGIVEAVKYPGWVHGGLFILYCIVLVLIATDQKWSLKKVGLAIAAGLLPFGPFYFHRKYHNQSV